MCLVRLRDSGECFLEKVMLILTVVYKNAFHISEAAGKFNLSSLPGK